MDNKKKNLVLTVVAIAFPISVFIWTYTSGGNFQKTMRAVFAASFISTSLITWRSARERGLSNAQFYLENAGGPEKLTKQAKRSRIIGRIFLAMPVLAFFFGLIIKSSIVWATTYGVFFSMFSLPLGLLMIWWSNKCFRIVSQEDHSTKDICLSDEEMKMKDNQWF